MKKKVLFTLIVVAVCTSMLFAQGAKDSTKKPNIVITADYIGNKNADKDKILSFSLTKDNTVASPYSDRREYAERKAREWAEANPEWGAEIYIQDTTNIAMEMSKTLTEVTAGIGPDLLHLDSFYVGTFLDANALQPLGQFVSQADLDEFFDWTKGVTVRDGEQYALWCETDARLLHYRKDLVPTPPRTWDDLIKMGSDLSKNKGVYGFLINAGQGEGASNECTWPFFWAQGGEIFDESGYPVLAEGENRQKLINIYTFLKELIDSGASPQAIASWQNSDPIMAEVAADNAAMIVNGTWAVSQMKELAPNPELWDYAPYPQMSADSYSNSCGGWTYAVLTDNSERARVAVDFVMRTAASKDAMAERCKIQSYIPTRGDVFDSDYFVNDVDMKRFKVELENGHARPASSLYPAISDLNAKAVSKVLSGQLTPAQAVDELAKQARLAWEDWK